MALLALSLAALPLGLVSSREDSPPDEGSPARRPDSAWVRRRETEQRLETINRSIVRYNARRQLDRPLPADWPALLAILVDQGLLPSAEAYALDGWGDAFVESPPGSVPVVRVVSVNLDGTREPPE